MTDASLKQALAELATLSEAAGPMQFMEVCGTHTVAFHRTGLRAVLPPNLRLISGPGCPVCVSSQGFIDSACALASRPNTVICSYGDMLRVPGRSGSLASHRAGGADVRVVYSPMDAVQMTVFITLPQALRAVIPALVGQVIALFKDTSLVTIISLFDFLHIARSVIPNQSAPINFQGSIKETLIFTAVVYWIFTFTFSRISLRLEKKLGVGER